MSHKNSPQGEEVVIVGTGETAEIAHEYFKHDSNHTIVAFSVDKEYRDDDIYRGLPVVTLEDLQDKYPPESYAAFVAVSSTKLNRIRTRLYNRVKEKGYSLVSYISSHAFVWQTADIGENVFIFENNVIQHGCTVGNNVVLWSGNHIGHQTKIGDNCFVTSHVVVSGFCQTGTNSFLGVNASMGDHLTIGEDCVLGAGAVVHKNLDGGKVYVGNPAHPLEKSSYESMGVEEP